MQIIILEFQVILESSRFGLTTSIKGTRELAVHHFNIKKRDGQCTINEGKPFLQENDPVQAQRKKLLVNRLKVQFDSHQLPDI
ncbi:hypothetical protein ACHAWX_001906 [Stephanocyclus meneghinianus]